MVFNRALADSQSLTDAPALSAELAKSDSTSVSEELAKLVSFPQTESISFADSEARDVGKAVDDGAATRLINLTLVTQDTLYDFLLLQMVRTGAVVNTLRMLLQMGLRGLQARIPVYK